jgi:hypothetical protein
VKLIEALPKLLRRLRDRPIRTNLIIWLAILAMIGEANVFAATVGPWTTRTFGTTDKLSILIPLGVLFAVLLVGTAYAVAYGVVWVIWKALRLQP